MQGQQQEGLKSRIIVYFKSAIAELKRMGQPRRVFVPTMNGKPIDNKMEKSIANYLIVYVLFFLVLLLCVSFEAGDFTTAFSSVAATFNNYRARAWSSRAYKQLLDVFWFQYICPLQLGWLQDVWKFIQSLCFSHQQQWRHLLEDVNKFLNK